MIILLAPEKLITSTSKEQWDTLKVCDVALFTSKSDSYIEFINHHLGGIFKRVEFFDDYPNNDVIEIKLLDYASQYDIKNIIPMTEADVLRVSKVKEKLQLNGLSYANAIIFRDKIAMKELARQFNIHIPRFKRIKHATDLTDFIEEVGYPIIVKPILGRGSLNTMRIADQASLIALLNSGLVRHESATLLAAVSAAEKVLTQHISYPALELIAVMQQVKRRQEKLQAVSAS